MSVDRSFWSRRRAAVEAETRADDQARVAAQQAELAEQDDAVVLEEMGLPDPDTLQPGDDFASFMAREVPEHLRNKALRKLWRSNPVLACVDGLNEYDDDYRAAMLAGGPVRTAYQVGKGMLAHVEEMARQEEAARVAAAAEADEPPMTEAPVEAPQQEITKPTPEPAPVVVAQDDTPDPAPRRMRFRFEETTV
ncbi:DUF3306 domain-containing protein [Roseobacter sp.]|uniref:DUF3306 domain-containing protein n=1 Tax=Roseobacter sp. TaxID=1907202 RepID=UPI0032971707